MKNLILLLMFIPVILIYGVTGQPVDHYPFSTIILIWLAIEILPGWGEYADTCSYQNIAEMYLEDLAGVELKGTAFEFMQDLKQLAYSRKLFEESR